MSIPRNTEMTKRILRTFDSATSTQVIDGLRWYPDAIADIDAIAEDLQVPRSQVAAIVAAMSPRLHWSRNLQAATDVILAHRSGRPASSVGGYFRVNVLKSYAILEGDTGALNGSKTVSFARNLSGDTDAVTVDVWAMRAAMGFDKQSLTSRQYDAIARSYRAAAARVGITPRELQAVVWCVERGRSH